MGGREQMVIGGGWGGSGSTTYRSLAGMVDEVVILRRVASAEAIAAFVAADAPLLCP